jgi:hypothetical protein
MSAMKRAVDGAEEAADAPVALAQSKVDEIHNGLVTPGDAAQEERNTRTRDRVLRRLSTADNHAARVTIARTALEQAKDRAELGTLLTELPSELASFGLDDDTISRVIEPVVRQRVPELAAAQDDLADKRFAATVSHHTAGVVRRGLRRVSQRTSKCSPSWTRRRFRSQAHSDDVGAQGIPRRDVRRVAYGCGPVREVAQCHCTRTSGPVSLAPPGLNLPCRVGAGSPS